MFYAILAALVILAMPAAAQVKPSQPVAPLNNPKFNGTVKTDALQILGPGSTGDGSGFTVTGGGRTRTLQDFASVFSGFVTNATTTNPETGQKTGPGFMATNPTQPFIFHTFADTWQGDNNDGGVLVTKEVNYNKPFAEPTSYFGAGALNGYTIHKGDTQNNLAGLVGQTLTYNTTNGQPFGVASSVGVVGQDVSKVPGAISGWGGLFNQIDSANTENPACCKYGIETGVFGYGNDNNESRRILLIVSQNSKVPFVAGDTVATIGKGVHMVAGSNSRFALGFDLKDAGRFTKSAFQMTAQHEQDISWANAAGAYNPAFGAGSKFFKGGDNNQYFDNTDGNQNNSLGFNFRTSEGLQAAINSQGIATPKRVAAPFITSGTANVGVQSDIYSIARDPAAADIPSGRCADWLNTSNNTLKRVCNTAGTIRSISYSP